MNRIFGKKKAEVPQVNISDVGGRVEGRTSDLDMKVCVQVFARKRTHKLGSPRISFAYLSVRVCVCVGTY